MTTRISSITVVFDEDIREDDAQSLLAMLRQVRNVADVVPNVGDISTAVATARVRAELSEKLWEVLQ